MLLKGITMRLMKQKILYIAILVYFFTVFIINISAGQKQSRVIIQVPIATENVNLRISPDIKSSVLYQLMIGENVEVIKVNEQIVNLNNLSGKWAYIKTYRGLPEGQDKGWVFDYYLGYENRFVKVTEWKYRDFATCVGDYCPSYRFRENGTFEVALPMCAGGICTEEQILNECKINGGKFTEEGFYKKEGFFTNQKFCYNSGQLFIYQNLIWAKCNNSNLKKYLFITKKDELCIPGADCQ